MITTTKLIRQYKRVVADEARGAALAPSAYFRALIVESLARAEHEAYAYLAKRGAPVRAAEVAQRFALSPTHALNLLNRLHDYGLVEKTPNPDSAYREWLWSVS